MKKIVVSLFILISVMCLSYAAIPDFMESPTSLQEMEKKCSCGGDLEWTAMAWQSKQTCVACNGRGKLGSGRYESTCNTCKGSGQISVWHSGYKCKSCGKVYKD